MADIATLGLKLDGRKARTEAQQTSQSLDKVKKAGSSLRTTMLSLGAVFSAGIIARKFIQNTEAAQASTAQLNAVLESTGGVAGLSAQELEAYADALQQTTKFGDEAVESAQALLLTFTKIRGPIFQDATDIVLDMATAMKTGLKEAAIQVGKALNDPILGVTALSRVGVQFSEAQREVIRNLVETGNAAEAQTLILKELQTEFGGSAEAARKTLGGALAFVSNQWNDLFEISTEASAGVISSLESIGRAIPLVANVMGEFFGGIQLLAVDAAVAVAKLQVEISKIGEGEVTGRVQRALGLGEGAGLFDPLGLDLFSKAVGVDLTQSLSAAEKNLELVEKAAEELREEIVLGGGGFVDFQAASQALRQEMAEQANTAKELAEEWEAFLDVLTRVQTQQERFGAGRDVRRSLQVQQDPLPTLGGGPLQSIFTDEDLGRYQAYIDRVNELTDAQEDGLPIIDSTISGFVSISRALDLLPDSVQDALDAIDSIVGGIENLGGAGSDASRAAAALSVLGGFQQLTFSALDALFGAGDSTAAQRLKEFAEIQEKAVQEFGSAVDKFSESAFGTPTAAAGGLGRALLELQESIDAILATATVSSSQGALGAWQDALSALDAQKVALLTQYAGQIARLNEAFREDLQVRLLLAQGLDKEAQQLRLRIQQERELAQARADGWDEVSIALLEQVQAAELAAATAVKIKGAEEELAEARERNFEKFIALAQQLDEVAIRGLRLTGQGAAADMAALLIQQQREFEALLSAGPEALALLNFVQELEREQLAREIAAAEQRDAIEQASEIEQEQLAEQIDIAKDMLSVARDQLREQERTVSTMRRVVLTLDDFGRSLLLGPLSILSPAQRLAEARSQFQAISALALGGDVTAAQSLPEASRALLEASRGFNASGPGFVSDFQKVQQTVALVEQQFANQLTVEEQMLVELKRQVAFFEDQISSLNAAQATAKASSDALLSALDHQTEEANARAREILLELIRQTGLLSSLSSGFKLQGQGRIVTRGEEDTNVIKRTIVKLAATQEAAAEKSAQSSDELKNAVEQSNVELQATVNVLSAGLPELVDRMERVERAVEGGTADNRRALEDSAPMTVVPS